LHPRRVEILRYLARRAGGEGSPPSVREIGAAVGLRSSQTVHHHLGWLEGRGTWFARGEQRVRCG
jgi:repressor LexA